jgi:hypothetical protein
MPQTPLANSTLRFLAHTFGDRTLSWGEKNHHWRILKKCPATNCRIITLDIYTHTQLKT